MKHKRFAAIAIAVIGTTVLMMSFTDEYYYKINKSFEVFGAVFREVANNYVSDVDPEDLMADGINGMLSSLDPYTVFIDEDHTDDIDFITNGAYVGFGITVGVRDSMLTIVGVHDGFSAGRQGIRIGDRLLRIDTSNVLYMTNDDLKRYTSGKAGSKAEVFVLRDGVSDTLHFQLTREEIRVNNISYSGVVFDSIGYIKLDRFSRRTGDEVRVALGELIHRDGVKSIILDLRGNPGGLLEAAVSTCEAFLAPGAQIVTTRGRGFREDRVYKSVSRPIDSNIPLAVLIDGYSASASEVVAGAVQDLDRGVIVGERSFGKGLVQSIFDMPYKTNLKMTTAKYYTPSGRCIQKIEYDKKKKTPHERDNYFYSLNGRKVVESKGIEPDSSVTNETFPEFVTELLKNDMFFGFASEYTSRISSLPRNFEVDDRVLEQFIKYVESKEIDYKSQLTKHLQALKQIAKNEPFSKKTVKMIDDLHKRMKSEETNPVWKYKKTIKKFLDYEIASRFLTEKQLIARSLTTDRYVRTAARLLAPSTYRRVLAIEGTALKNRN